MFIFYIIITILFIILFIFIYYRLYDINQFFKSNNFKRESEGFSDLLLYDCLIEDNIVLLKNGSLLTCFSYEGKDLSQLPEDDKIMMSELINKAIFELGSGWTINFDAIRVETNSYSDRSLSFFPDKVSYAIDEERRTLFNSKDTMYVTTNFISLLYTPPKIIEKKFIDSMYTKGDETDELSIADKNLLHFKSKIEHFFSIINNVLTTFSLGNITYTYEDNTYVERNSLLEYLNYCITGKNQIINVPTSFINIDLLIGGQDFFTGICPKIDDNYIACIAIDGFPAESYPTILNKLSDIPINCRFSTRFICIDKYEAESKLKKIKNKWSQAQRGMMSIILNQAPNNHNTNWDAVEMTDDAIEGITLQQSDRALFGYYTANIVLMEKNEELLKEYSLMIKKLITSLGFNARIEGINCVEAFIGTIPGHIHENVRRFFIHSLNLADLIPKNTIWTGHEFNPCDFYGTEAPALLEAVTVGNTPYHLNVHVDDVGHTLIIGPTGAGKSTLLATIAAQARRYKDATIYCFDKGMSMYTLCQAVGGKHFNLATDGCDLIFNPFQYIDTFEDIAWLVSYIESILLLNNITITPAMNKTIHDAINNLAKLKEKNSEYIPNITEFKSQLQYSDINLREIIDLYDVAGSLGGFISGTNDNLSLSNFTVFEIETVMNLDAKILLPILDYLFRRIDRNLKGQPAYVILDEAWVAFNNEVFQKKIIEWLKVFRKRNCSVILATQNLFDITLNSESLLTELIISTSSKIFLPNISATKSEFARIYKKFGLNEQQINIISNAIPKKHYYHYSNEGSRLFELALGELALKFVAVSSSAAIKEIKNLIDKYGDNWVDEYLANYNININKYLTYYKEKNDGNI